MASKTEEVGSRERCHLTDLAAGEDLGLDQSLRGLAQCRLFLSLAILALILVGLVLFGVLAGDNNNTKHGVVYTTLLVVALALLGLAILRAWRDLIKPLGQIRRWALQMRGGNLASRITVPKTGEFAELAQDINSLGDMLESLARDTEQQLQEHTEHITQKTRSLRILYDVAASISVSRDLNELLTRFLHTLTEVVSARAASVRLLNDKGEMELVSSSGMDADLVEKEHLPPAKSCLCVRATNGESVLSQADLLPCTDRLARPFFGRDEVSMLAVPLQYRDQTLGVYNLFIDQRSYQAREDFQDLFLSIGRHLGMAIAKARLDEEAQFMSIMEERTRIAHELHDSLAQTLASLRFQVRVMDETMHQDDEATSWQALERIENTLDEANTELRELIAHFRAPVHQQGLVPAIEQIVQKVRRDCDIPIFLQKEWPNRKLPAEVEMQVLRIVQEALANIRKHSQANAVRVMLSGNEQGQYRVLVEDDGVGLGNQPQQPTAAGEHLGLSILEDRAARIGGRVRVESEPGEGTRVVLDFEYPRKQDSAKDNPLTYGVDEIARTGRR